MALFIKLGAISIVLVFSFFIGRTWFNNKRKAKAVEAIKKVFNDNNINYTMNISLRNYDVKIETGHLIYLFRLLWVSRDKEVVVTNKYTWIKKDRHSELSINNRIPHIKEFIDYEGDTKKRVKKIAVIPHDIINILKYINESEMVIVRANVDVYGCNIIKIEDLNSLIK